MRKLVLLAGAVAMIATTPLLAQGRGRGHGNRGHGLVPAQPHPRGCPPGLATRGCLAPGQARHLFGIGDRIPSGYRWTNIPEQYLSQVTIDPRYRYLYNDRVVYVVDPTTQLVQSIVDLID